MLLSTARAAKKVILDSAVRSGVASLVRDSKWRSNRLMILCYHGVSLDDEHLWGDLYVSRDHLGSRLALLRRERYEVLPLAVALQHLYGGSLPPRSVAITFDDGTYDFHSRAYPVLCEYGMSAMLYQTTYYCFFQRPVFDPVTAYLLWKGRGLTISLGDITGEARQVVIPDGQASRVAFHQHIRTAVAARRLDAEEKDQVALRLAQKVRVDYDRILEKRMLHLMTPQEVASLDPAIVDIQLHTHRHRTPRSHPLFERELQDNANAIRRMCGSNRSLQHFCYPSGDYAPEFFGWLREQGIVSATTCDPQIATASSDPLLLPRFIDSMQISESFFRAWLSGAASFLPQRPRA